MDKKVSVIIPCYNKEKYIKDAVESVINQTYRNIELVCINDASEDNSLIILEELKEKYPTVVLINEKTNQGVVQARNSGIDIAKGEYILPLDADDTIEPTYIEKCVKILNENSDIGIVYCIARIIGKTKRVWKLSSFNKSDFLYRNCIFCTAMFRKSDFIKVGKYKSYMNVGPEDWDLWLSFIEIGLKPYQIPEILFNYRVQKRGTRSEITKNTSDIWMRNMFINHMGLYLEDKTFFTRVFTSKKYKKYKTLFNIMLIICCIQIVAIFILIFFTNKI